MRKTGMCFLLVLFSLILLTVANADDVTAPGGFTGVSNYETIHIEQDDSTFQVGWGVSPDADYYLVSAKLLHGSPDLEPNENSDGISLLNHESTSKTKIKVPLDELEQQGWVKIAVCAVNESGEQSKWPCIYLFFMRQKEEPEINIRKPKDSSVFTVGEEIDFRITGEHYDHYYYEVYCDGEFVDNDTLYDDLDGTLYLERAGSYHISVVATNSDELNTVQGQHYTGDRDEDTVDFWVEDIAEPEIDEDISELLDETFNSNDVDDYENLETEGMGQDEPNFTELPEEESEHSPQHSDATAVVTEDMETQFDDEEDQAEAYDDQSAEESWDVETQEAVSMPAADEEYEADANEGEGPAFRPGHSEATSAVTEEMVALFDDEDGQTEAYDDQNAEESWDAGTQEAVSMPAADEEYEADENAGEGPALHPGHSEATATVTEEMEAQFDDEDDQLIVDEEKTEENVTPSGHSTQVEIEQKNEKQNAVTDEEEDFVEEDDFIEEAEDYDENDDVIEYIEIPQPTVSITSPCEGELLQCGKVLKLNIDGENCQYISYTVKCDGDIVYSGKANASVDTNLPMRKAGYYTLTVSAVNVETTTVNVHFTVQEKEEASSNQSTEDEKVVDLLKPEINIESPVDGGVYDVGALPLTITGKNYHHFDYTLSVGHGLIVNGTSQKNITNTIVPIKQPGTYTLMVRATNFSTEDKGYSVEKTITFAIVDPTIRVDSDTVTTNNNHIVINGTDIGFGSGDYYTKNGKACRDLYALNETCHGHGICVDNNDDVRCNCLRYPVIDGVMVDTYASQCLGFARYVQYMLYGTHEWEKGKYNTTNFQKIAVNAGKINAQQLKKYIEQAGIGSHLRFNYDSHSVIITDYDDDGFSFVQCNWCTATDLDGKCKVTTAKYTWGGGATFISGRGGIDFISMYIGQ